MDKPYDLTHEELDPSIKTGVGNPLSPYNDQLLSAEDEKSIDDKGRRVIRGKPWSQARTNTWLVIGLHDKESGVTARKLRGKADIDLSGVAGRPVTLTVASSRGRPTFLHPVIGACLEIPDDLAEDDIKRQYVVEWLIHTVDEAMRKMKVGVKKEDVPKVAAAVADAANISIGKIL
jgi:hypothetical protein